LQRNPRREMPRCLFAHSGCGVHKSSERRGDRAVSRSLCSQTKAAAGLEGARTVGRRYLRPIFCSPGLERGTNEEEHRIGRAEQAPFCAVRNPVPTWLTGYHRQSSFYLSGTPCRIKRCSTRHRGELRTPRVGKDRAPHVRPSAS
jgi:hypothetical protein